LIDRSIQRVRIHGTVASGPKLVRLPGILHTPWSGAWRIERSSDGCNASFEILSYRWISGNIPENATLVSHTQGGGRFTRRPSNRAGLDCLTRAYATHLKRKNAEIAKKERFGWKKIMANPRFGFAGKALATRWQFSPWQTGVKSRRSAKRWTYLPAPGCLSSLLLNAALTNVWVERRCLRMDFAVAVSAAASGAAAFN